MKRLEHLQQESRESQMNEEERRHLRELLLSHIDKNPVKDTEGGSTLSYPGNNSSAKVGSVIFLLALVAVAIATAIFMTR